MFPCLSRPECSAPRNVATPVRSIPRQIAPTTTYKLVFRDPLPTFASPRGRVAIWKDPKLLHLKREA